MANVLVIVKVYPSSVDIDLEELAARVAERLPEGYELARKSVEPIAFGLSALRLFIVMPEETEGGTSRIEEILSGIDGVEEFEVEAVHRLSY